MPSLQLLQLTEHGRSFLASRRYLLPSICVSADNMDGWFQHFNSIIVSFFGGFIDMVLAFVLSFYGHDFTKIL